MENKFYFENWIYSPRLRMSRGSRVAARSESLYPRPEAARSSIFSSLDPDTRHTSFQVSNGIFWHFITNFIFDGIFGKNNKNHSLCYGGKISMRWQVQEVIYFARNPGRYIVYRHRHSTSLNFSNQIFWIGTDWQWKVEV